MGHNQDDAADDGYAVRASDLERAFETLPEVGTAAYWGRIEQTDGGPALPLEVLARSLSERHAAAARSQSARIFESILRRIQTPVAIRSRRVAKQARGGMREQLQEDLEQECYVKLWQDLTNEDPTFFLVNFSCALTRLQQHVAHAVMEQAGEWKRPGTAQPTRIPENAKVREHAQQDAEGGSPIADTLPDHHTEPEFAQADLSDLRDLVTRLPAEQRDLINDLFWRDLSQQDIAAQRHVTTRTIYNWLQPIYKQLRERYAGGEEDQRGQ